MTPPSLARRCVAEAVGTAMLVAVGPGAIMVAARTGAFGHAEVSLAFGLVVTIIVAALGEVSGAHVNPAVTLAFAATSRFPRREVAPYVAAQAIGAVAASLLLRWLLGRVGGMGATVPSLPLAPAFVVEAGYSALLMLVILGTTRSAAAPVVAPFAIGATVWAGALVTGPLTGGSFNPVRSLGPAVAGGPWTMHWLYWAAPITGMLVAALSFDRVVSSERSRG